MTVPHYVTDAACGGHAAELEYWFQTGARNPNERAVRGHTLLNLACDNGHCDAVAMLLKHGADPNAICDTGSEYWCTPLHEAATQGGVAKRRIAAVLLDVGSADVDSRNFAGSTPLMDAAWSGDCRMLRLLLSRGAALAARDASKSTRDDAGVSIGDDAESYAEYSDKKEAAALLAAARVAGGTWKHYLRDPRVRLLMLRVLCERKRAEVPEATICCNSALFSDLLTGVLSATSLCEAQAYARAMERRTSIAPRGVLERLFSHRAPAPALRAEPAASRARASPSAALPKEVFWHILSFWRSDRDDEADAMLAPTDREICADVLSECVAFLADEPDEFESSAGDDGMMIGSW